MTSFPYSHGQQYLHDFTLYMEVLPFQKYRYSKKIQIEKIRFNDDNCWRLEQYKVFYAFLQSVNHYKALLECRDVQLYLRKKRSIYLQSSAKKRYRVSTGKTSVQKTTLSIRDELSILTYDVGCQILHSNYTFLQFPVFYRS